jgi:hypothetical protein
MRGAIPPFTQYVFMAWCLVKHRDNFTFTIILIQKQCKHDMDTYGGVALPILNTGTIWRVNVQLHAPAALPHYPPDKRVGGPQRRYERCGEQRKLRMSIHFLKYAVVKRKIPSPRRESNPRTPIVQPVAQRYTD